MNNPYESPTESDPPPEQTKPTPASEGVAFPNYLPVVQFALRLLGVYIFLGGACYAVGNAVEMAISYRESGYFPYYLFGRTVGDVIYAAAGLYLLFGGRWVIEKVFLPFSTSSDSH